MKKLYSVAAMMLLFVLQGYSQDIGTAAKNFDSTWIRPLIPVIGAICFIVGAMMNAGKLQGDNKDYKGFFMGVGLYLGGFILAVLIYKFIFAYAI